MVSWASPVGPQRVVEAGSAGGLFLSQRHQLVVDRTESVELGFLVVVVVKGSLVKHTHQKVLKGAVYCS